MLGLQPSKCLRRRLRPVHEMSAAILVAVVHRDCNERFKSGVTMVGRTEMMASWYAVMSSGLVESLGADHVGIGFE